MCGIKSGPCGTILSADIHMFLHVMERDNWK